MTDFRKSLAAIGAVRSKFEQLLLSQRGHPIGAATATARPGREGAQKLREIEDFGSNPGNLRMLVHVPANARPAPGLVIALHGCGQTAAEYSAGAGWSSLADAHGFIVVYPEQQQANNQKNCFTWFMPDDISRGSGEAASIQHMTEHAIARYGADRRRVFVTGLSAGGAMASVMLATYPETYAAGAIIAGLPYGCAGTVQEAFEAMFSEKAYPASSLGEKVRRASGHRGPWPAISIWHGSADAIVKPSNADHCIVQWLDVHGLGANPSHSAMVGPHTHRIWSDVQGRPAIEAFTLAGMPHAVPLDLTGRPDASCGAMGPFFVDVGLSSTLYCARSWGLADVPYSLEQATAARLGDMPWVQPGGTSADGMIAAALSGAGLASQAGSPDAAKRLRPADIVEAALRQAGLKR